MEGHINMKVSEDYVEGQCMDEYHEIMVQNGLGSQPIKEPNLSKIYNRVFFYDTFSSLYNCVKMLSE